ncbi:MAG: hypothetical protein ACFFD4_31160, partial [Candidatus Odinarchaeota archaeon]
LNSRKYYPNYFDHNDQLVDVTIDWLNRIQRVDGSWYTGNISLAHKINGAMKILTGLKIVDEPIPNPEKLTDLCLGTINDEQACDNFNVVYVLYNCAKQLEFSYRKKEIEEFCIDRLKKYTKYYHPDIGGFSFYPNKSNIYYYGARITKGLNEPDIHGTLMFVWGISLISRILDIEKDIGIVKSFDP